MERPGLRPLTWQHHTRVNSMVQLYIGNKNYSSWSMRSWVLMRQAGVDFEQPHRLHP